MKKFASRIKKYLLYLPEIIWLPIETIIFVIYEFFFRINRSVLKGFSSEKYEESRIRRIVYKAIGASLKSHSNILSSYHSRRIAKIFTFLLQIISLITTYAGFTFFLGNLNPIAPLLIAIVVQGGCFYLLNYTAANKRSGQWRRYILLFVLIAISVTTSFMGIFNSIVSPIESMNDTYYSYVSAANRLLDYKTSTIFKSYTNTEINTTYGFIEEKNELARTNIESQSKTYEAFDTTINEPYTYFDNWGNTYVELIPIEKEDLKTKKETLKENIDLLSGYFEDTNHFLDSIKISDVQKAYEKLTSNPQSYKDENNSDKKIYTSFQKAINAAKQINKALNNQTEDISKLELSALEEYSEKNKEYNEFRLPYDINSENPNKDNSNEPDKKETETTTPNYSQIIKDNNVFSVLNRIVVPEDMIEAETTRNKIINKVKKNYKDIIEYDEQILNSELANDDLKKYIDNYNSEYEKAINIESPQVMALTNSFSNPHTIGKAIFSLSIALIVDGLSVLISFALLIKKKSVLYYDDISKYRANREEMVEECFMYICLNDIKKNPPSNKTTTSETQITSTVANKMNDVMGAFLLKIHYCYFPDEFNAFGYISKDDYEKFSDEEKRLFVTFCNISMIQAFHQKEIIDLINHEFDENEKQTNTPKANDELVDTYRNLFPQNQIYYIVSKSLHVWTCENFSELLQNTMMFYDDKDFVKVFGEIEAGDENGD